MFTYELSSDVPNNVIRDDIKGTPLADTVWEGTGPWVMIVETPTDKETEYGVVTIKDVKITNAQVLHFTNTHNHLISTKW